MIRTHKSVKITAVIVLAAFLSVILAVILIVPDNRESADEKINLQPLSDESYTSDIRYDFLPADVMPVMGYVAMPCENAVSGTVNPTYLTKTHFENYKNAGFNVLTGLYERIPFNTPEVMRAIDMAEETGLVYFVSDTAYLSGEADIEQYAELLRSSSYINSAAFGGLVLDDEPPATAYEGMYKVNRALESVAPGKISHVTLFPFGAPDAWLGVDDVEGDSWTKYTAYATRYVEITHPFMLSYDYYNFFTPDETLESIGMSDKVVNLIKCMSLYRSLALQHNIPLWLCINSFNHSSGTQMTQKMIDWSVNLSLAYGAKGIQYYTYWSGVEGYEGQLENPNYSGMVTIGGNPHNTYYKVQKANRQIAAVDELLMKCRSKGIIQYGEQLLSIPNSDKLYGFKELRLISGGNCIVGCFEKDNGNSVFYILNNSINAGEQTFNVSLNKISNVRMVNRNMDTSLEDVGSVGVNLAGGEAVAIEVIG